MPLNVLLPPVPPFDAQQSRNRLRIEAVFYDACGIADDDGIRRYILCDDGTRPDDGTAADADAAHDRHISADPDIAANDDLMAVV